MTDYPTIPLKDYREYPVDEMRERVRTLYKELSRRRTVREFSGRTVPIDIIETALKVAGTAPSGANLQPWHFVVVSGADAKRKIREAAEVEEREFYEHRASPEWLAALEPLGTDSDKPFLETAPYLIAVFLQKFGYLEDGRKVKHYYPVESTGLATGILGRPTSERPFLLLVVGYPAEDARVPDIHRKELGEFATFVED